MEKLSKTPGRGAPIPTTSVTTDRRHGFLNVGRPSNRYDQPAPNPEDDYVSLSGLPLRTARLRPAPAGRLAPAPPQKKRGSQGRRPEAGRFAADLAGDPVQLRRRALHPVRR